MTATTESSSTAEELPVLISGAGPCGLVTALTLQQQQIPCLLLERASRDTLCSNAGSGIDMAPTAIHILEEALGVPLMGRAMRAYDYLHISDMDEQAVTTLQFRDWQQKENRVFGFANRADLQRVLLEELEPSRLHCGVSVKSFTQCESHVEVQLSDGTTRKGSVLLACDGIHSAIRTHMYQQQGTAGKKQKDPLHYCGQECWWGKAKVEPGAELDTALRNLEEEHNMQTEEDNGALGAVGIAYYPTPQRPGCFFSCPVSSDTHAWVYMLENKTSPLAQQSNDLTRRGGTVLTAEQKRQELLEQHEMATIVRLLVEATPDVTRAAFFDRENLSLPYTQGRVALLGDAAHPQSPAMGQGANMAIVDGYVMAMRLAAAVQQQTPVEAALRDYDSRARRTANNKVIRAARTYGRYAVSTHPFTRWAMRLLTQYMPASTMIAELTKGDRSNKEFVKAMQRDEQKKKYTAKQ